MYGTRIAALLLILGVAIACGGGGPAPSPTPTSDVSLTPTPTPTTTTPTPSATPPPIAGPPERDLFDLARRFRGLPPDTARTVRDSPYGYAVGDREQFNVLDINQPSVRTITATVRLITERAYFFVEDGVAVDDATLQTIGADFERLVYPAVTSAFGKEWSPGVDADRRISIVHADLRGAGGYVSSSDEYPRAVASRSNEREAIYVDSTFLDAPGVQYNALVAHELQHMVHWFADPGEESWINEGLSQVAAELAGGGTASLDSFLAIPDTQLNDWPTAGGGIHYGESQLFIRYLLDRFGGRDNASALLATPGDGIAGVDEYLGEFDTTFREVFADWIVANYLDEESGRFAHDGIYVAASNVETIDATSDGDASVHQFAADYLEIDPPAGGGVFTFDGSDEVSIGIDPRDGPFWWSNEGDSIDSRLTREFDLSGLTSASLRFRTWFSVELGWDYAYVAVSGDGGATWEALRGRHTSDFDPVGQAYGPGYTGDSDGEWLQEEIDLTRYAGKKVLVRFEYVTDDSAHERGFAVDDISIPELGFDDGGESGDGWQAEGFRRIEGTMPQRFVLRLVERGEPSHAVPIQVDDEGNTATVIFGDSPATIVIAAVTEGTTEAATYRWSLRAP